MGLKIIPLIIIGLIVFLGYVGYINCIISKEIIFEKWIPSFLTPLIAGTFLIWLVPWVNHKYWEVRAQNERKWADERFKKEIISDAAEFIEGAFLYKERLEELKTEEEKLHPNFPTELRQEQYAVHRDKLKNEMGIGKMSRLIEIYFPESESVIQNLKDWISMYNEISYKAESIKFTEDHPLVAKARDLLKAMRQEIDSAYK